MQDIEIIKKRLASLNNNLIPISSVYYLEDVAVLLAAIAQKDTEIAALRERIKELEGALEKYGSHSPPDGSPICGRSMHSDYLCTCGFEQALKGGQR